MRRRKRGMRENKVLGTGDKKILKRESMKRRRRTRKRSNKR